MFYIFLQRALDISNFVSGRISISQNIPENWKELSIEGPDRVRRKFSDEKITVVWSIDESVIRDHETTN